MITVLLEELRSSYAITGLGETCRSMQQTAEDDAFGDMPRGTNEALRHGIASEQQRIDVVGRNCTCCRGDNLSRTLLCSEIRAKSLTLYTIPGP